MTNRYYVYYQPNKYDMADKRCDCSIRAVAKALDVDWEESYKRLCELGLQFHDVPTSWNLIGHLLSSLCFDYVGLKIQKGKKRPTVKSFAREHKSGTYLLQCASHVVTVIDGKYYDTWDCGDCSVYSYYSKGGE